jgi:hypothetical protein
MARFLPVTVALGASLAMAQDPEAGFRQLWNTELLKKRPEAPTTAEAKSPAKNSSEALKATYKRVSPPVVAKKATPAKDTGAAKGVVKPAATATETVLGVTLWRLRPPTPEQAKDKRLLIVPKGPKAYSGPTIATRVAANEPVAPGEMLRIGVEVPRTGFLYIIDREVYADGTMSDPYLIYPNHLTRPGDNVVTAGRLLEIPDRRDNPDHFVLQPTPSGKKLVAEQFSVFVTPQPLPDNMRAPEGEALKITEKQYMEWEEKYFVDSECWELTGGDGKPVTVAEMEAGSGSGKLTQADALPQTLYKVTCEPDKPILVKIPVKIKQ